MFTQRIAQRRRARSANAGIVDADGFTSTRNAARSRRRFRFSQAHRRRRRRRFNIGNRRHPPPKTVSFQLKRAQHRRRPRIASHRHPPPQTVPLSPQIAPCKRRRSRPRRASPHETEDGFIPATRPERQFPPRPVPNREPTRNAKSRNPSVGASVSSPNRPGGTRRRSFSGCIANHDANASAIRTRRRSNSANRQPNPQCAPKAARQPGI